MLSGTLVDLVPYGERFQQNDHRWWNTEAKYWGSMGDRNVVTQAQVDREHDEWRSRQQPRTGVPFGIQTKEGKPLGYIGINWLSVHNRIAELGAIIGEPDYWGGGYGTDALLLVVDYAFDVLDVRKVWLSTMALNARVLRQMEKVGFALEAWQREGTFVDGGWVDAVTFGRVRDGWPGYSDMVNRLGIQPR